MPREGFAWGGRGADSAPRRPSQLVTHGPGRARGGMTGLNLQTEALARAAEPVHDTSQHPEESGPTPGIALCLSGGGYRAMLFHVGALTRLNELGYLPKIDRVSSVSGGSITAGVLGKQWRHLRFNGVGSAENFNELVTEPLRRIAGKTIDLPSILLGLLPLSSVGDRLAGAYGRHLFGKKTLQDLPDRPPTGNTSRHRPTALG